MIKARKEVMADDRKIEVEGLGGEVDRRMSRSSGRQSRGQAAGPHR